MYITLWNINAGWKCKVDVGTKEKTVHLTVPVKAKMTGFILI